MRYCYHPVRYWRPDWVPSPTRCAESYSSNILWNSPATNWNTQWHICWGAKEKINLGTVMIGYLRTYAFCKLSCLVSSKAVNTRQTCNRVLPNGGDNIAAVVSRVGFYINEEVINIRALAIMGAVLTHTAGGFLSTLTNSLRRGAITLATVSCNSWWNSLSRFCSKRCRSEFGSSLLNNRERAYQKGVNRYNVNI